MTDHGLVLLTPDGRPHRVPRPAADSSLTLAEWLEIGGWPLNTRCGGRGLCRGCQVDLAPAPGLARACQVPAASLANASEAPTRLQIPALSWRDPALQGQTAFTLARRVPHQARPGLGLALDVGTTTVAAALCDLNDGALLATAARSNAQRRHGDDVLSRLTFSLARTDNRSRLQHALVAETLQPLLSHLLTLAGRHAADISEAAVTGNPIMLHSLLGRPLDGFARYPFRPEFLGPRVASASSIGLSGEFPLCLLPSLGPFVGSDLTAGLLASCLDSADAPALLLDLGTNGEIVLRTPDGFLATATAAGPAFEGGRLACGGAARANVVTDLSFRDGQWHHLLASGDGPPVALAGSAYIAFLAEARRRHLISPLGRFSTREGLGFSGDGSGRHTIVAGELFVSEADIAELLQAKAALAAGVAALLDVAGLACADLRKVFLAGGLGQHVNVDHARAIGLLPNLPLARFEAIGNASLAGASLFLRDPDLAPWEAVARHTRYLELNQIPSFADHFADALRASPYPDAATT